MEVNNYNYAEKQKGNAGKTHCQCLRKTRQLFSGGWNNFGKKVRENIC